MAMLLDPTSELSPAGIRCLPRVAGLQGRVLGLLDISKPRGDLFIDRLQERLGEHGATIRRYRKPTFTRLAPLELRQQIAEECDLVIEALAD